jgi:uncharacterized delta-60 repeat protein
MKKMKKIFLLFLLNSLHIQAQIGALDTSFNPGNIGQYGFGAGANGYVYSINIQNDNKIIIGGHFTSYNGNPGKYIARINSDGTYDSSFNTGIGPNENVRTTAIQSDGKIIIGGFFTSVNGNSSNYLARLNIDGSLDTTFNTGNGANNVVTSLKIQNDGKIIIVGYFTQYDGVSRNGLARINTDGTLDINFNPSNTSGTNAIALQSDGKILVGGNTLKRINPDGTLDNTFNIGTGGIKSISIQNDNKIIVGGNFNYFNGIERDYIARINTDGSLDYTFNANTLLNDQVLYSSIQSDGKILVSSFSYVKSLNIDGSIDTLFNLNNGTVSNIYSIAVQNDNKIIIGGNGANYNSNLLNGVFRINPDNTIDTSFNQINEGIISSICLQDDGKILIGGRFNSVNNITVKNLARLNSDGTLDNDFTLALGSGPNNDVWDIEMQNTEIIIGGYFNSINGSNSHNGIARIGMYGYVYTNFGNSLTNNPYNLIAGLSIQPDSKVIIGGQFTFGNESTLRYLGRLNYDGTIDNSFNLVNGPDGPVKTIEIQSDGKIIIGGWFSNVNAVSRNHFARLNSDGSLDTSFTIGTGANDIVDDIAIQDDGKIIMVGRFTNINGIEKNYIARLNSDGSIDNTFDTSNAANGNIYSLSIQDDGKIIIGGDFTSYQGININRIARLNNDGSLDVSFIPTIGANGLILDTEIQSDSKILLGGSFTSYDNISAFRIARVNGDNSLNNFESQNDVITIYPNPANNKFIIDFGSEAYSNFTIKIKNLLGQLIYNTIVDNGRFEIIKSWTGQGLYIVNIINDKGQTIDSRKILFE